MGVEIIEDDIQAIFCYCKLNFSHGRYSLDLLFSFEESIRYIGGFSPRKHLQETIWK